MSGGVDSSVAALLLAQQDYDLSAVFMRNWDTRDESGTDKGCEWEKDWEDVQLVCKKLDVPCSMVSSIPFGTNPHTDHRLAGRSIQRVLEPRLCASPRAMGKWNITQHGRVVQ